MKMDFALTLYKVNYISYGDLLKILAALLAALVQEFLFLKFFSIQQELVKISLFMQIPWCIVDQ